MYAALTEFIKNDNGFGQYADRYEEISDDLIVRRQFAAWIAEMDKLDIMSAVGEARGIVIGEARGMQKKAVEAAKIMLSKGISPETVAECLELPLSQVQELENQLNNNHLVTNETNGVD